MLFFLIGSELCQNLIGIIFRALIWPLHAKSGIKSPLITIKGVITDSSKLLGGEVPGGVPEGGLPDYVES